MRRDSWCIRPARQPSEPRSHEYFAPVASAIILAYSYLEADFSEFVHLIAITTADVSDECRLVISTIASENLRPAAGAHTLQRFNMMLRILGKGEMPESAEPYQSTELVRQLRNMLVHPVPGRVVTFDANEETELFMQQSITRKLRGPLKLAKNATFPHDVLTVRCAAWAVKSCETSFAEFTDRSGVHPGFLTK